MRSAVPALALAAFACGGRSSVEDLGVGDGDEAPIACEIDEDCAVASTSCCDCPTFAVPAAIGADCSPIECAPLDCAPTEAVCDAGTCRLTCVAIEATAICDRGFEVDAAGCAIDACAMGAPECQLDSDCVQVPADCCGCALGGGETAVPVDDADAHLAGLDCGEESFCPGINSCDEAATPRCLGGTCRLVSGADLDNPFATCGAPDAQDCPEGEICVLNDPAAPPGVAICRQM